MQIKEIQDEIVDEFSMFEDWMQRYEYIIELGKSLEANTDFIDEIGLKEHLSPTRANGLVSMIKQIKMYALAFQAKQSN